jgi:diguanylate cyclase (GGDEF)-like protein/PAS domain S-box-containing protein
VAPLGALPGMPRAKGGVIVWWRDVTPGFLAEQRQRELGALLELALMGANLAFWDVDVQTGQVRSHNDRWHAILGYASDDLVDNFDAWDKLVHPEDAQARLAAWNAHIEGRTPRYEAEFRMRHKAGHWVWLQARGQAVARGPDGRALRLVGTRQDITQAKLAQQGLHALANTDELTGLDNRRRFMQRADEELERARRYGLPVALLMMDLDHFKAINDRLGHAGGDEVLRSFATTGRSVMRQSDLFGRIGGEEFAALLPHTALDGACIIGQRLLDQVRQQPAWWAAAATPYTVSVGVSLATGNQSVQQLIAAADAALYQAKAQGRNRLAVA